MDLHRAEAILKTPATIEVFYHGTPVWIKSINPAQQTAQVTLDPQGLREVPVADLNEGDTVLTGNSQLD